MHFLTTVVYQQSPEPLAAGGFAPTGIAKESEPYRGPDPQIASCSAHNAHSESLHTLNLSKTKAVRPGARKSERAEVGCCRWRGTSPLYEREHICTVPLKSCNVYTLGLGQS